MTGTAKENCFCKTEQGLTGMVEPLLAWYARAARPLPWRADADPYRVWISEIMLQQTRVEAVIPYYERFLAALPDVRALAAVPEETLMKLWEGLGYYSRARNLRRAAEVICETCGGVFPSDPAALRALPGIGPYTAGAIASICFGLPAPAVDGNVLRVLARLCACGENVLQPSVRRAAEEALAAVYPAGHCAAFTQSLMELGALVCVPGGPPRCAACPLAAHCAAHAAGRENDFPVREKKATRREEELTVFLLSSRGHLALRRRPASGLLAGLWELPNTPGVQDEAGVRDCLAAWGLTPRALSPGPMRRHVFTHVTWHMHGWLVECEAPAGAFRWVAPDELEDELPLPTAFRRMLE